MFVTLPACLLRLICHQNFVHADDMQLGCPPGELNNELNHCIVNEPHGESVLRLPCALHAVLLHLWLMYASLPGDAQMTAYGSLRLKLCKFMRQIFSMWFSKQDNTNGLVLRLTASLSGSAHRSKDYVVLQRLVLQNDFSMSNHSWSLPAALQRSLLSG